MSDRQRNSSTPDHAAQQVQRTMRFSSVTEEMNTASSLQEHTDHEKHVVVHREEYIRREMENKSLKKFTRQLTQEMKSAMDNILQKDAEMENLKAEYDEILKTMEKSLRQSEIQIEQLKIENAQLSKAVARSMGDDSQEVKEHDHNFWWRAQELLKSTKLQIMKISTSRREDDSKSQDSQEDTLKQMKATYDKRIKSMKENFDQQLNGYISQIKEHGEEGKVLVLERIINDQSVKLEDLESLVKQVIESQQTLAKTSEETIEQMQEAMDDKEAQLQQCCDEKDKRVKQLEELVSQLSDEVEIIHIKHKEGDHPLKNIKKLTGVVDLNKEIGRGSYGVVKEVCVHGTTCAAKDIHKILIEYSAGESLEVLRKKFYEECVNCSKLIHPNIVQFLGIYYSSVDATLPWLVMEKMHCSLSQFLEQHKQNDTSLSVKLSLLMDVSLGLQYLHAHNVIHRDLSSNNILLSKYCTAKIADLGVAKLVTADSKKSYTVNPGTQAFMPPEVVSASPHYGKPVDVFSLGCVMIHTLTHMYPIPADQVVIIDSLSQDMKALSEVDRREKYLKAIPSSAMSCRPLIEKCLKNSPGRRPFIAEVCTEIPNVQATYHYSATEIPFMSNLELSRKIEELESVLADKEQTIKQLKIQPKEQANPTTTVRQNIHYNEEYQKSKSSPRLIKQKTEDEK